MRFVLWEEKTFRVKSRHPDSDTLPIEVHRGSRNPPHKDTRTVSIRFWVLFTDQRLYTCTPHSGQSHFDTSGRSSSCFGQPSWVTLILLRLAHNVWNAKGFVSLRWNQPSVITNTRYFGPCDQLRVHRLSVTGLNEGRADDPSLKREHIHRWSHKEQAPLRPSV